MAWQLQKNYTTSDFLNKNMKIVKPISDDDLQAGDILLAPGHVLIFDRWEDGGRAGKDGWRRYWVYEQGYYRNNPLKQSRHSISVSRAARLCPVPVEQPVELVARDT